MTPTLAAPLTPFADALPVPQRLVAAQESGRLSVPIRAGAHRFHRDLPESAIWGYDGTVPGPTIEAEQGQPVTVQWRNELDGALPVVVTTAPRATDASGVPVQCVPGLSGGTPGQRAAALAGHTVGTCMAGLSRRRMTAGPKTSSCPARMRSSTIRWASGRRCCGTTTT